VGWRGSIHNATRGEATKSRGAPHQTLEALARLAGRAARKFEDLLYVGQGYAELGMSRLPAAHPVFAYLTQLKAATKQALVLAEGLEAFSGRQALNPETLDLNHLLQRLSRRLERLLPASVAVDLDLRAALSQVYADPFRLQQALMHLVDNACEAMPHGGRLKIASSETTLDDLHVCQPSDATVGMYVCVAVTDTGVGVDYRILGDIIEPFFSTKPMGNGLGLSATWGIIRQHHGYLHISSPPGQGTSVRLYLPALT
jgi:signal transduction histidine kinase